MKSFPVQECAMCCGWAQPGSTHCTFHNAYETNVIFGPLSLQKFPSVEGYTEAQLVEVSAELLGLPHKWCPIRGDASHVDYAEGWHPFYNKDNFDKLCERLGIVRYISPSKCIAYLGNIEASHSDIRVAVLLLCQLIKDSQK